MLQALTFAFVAVLQLFINCSPWPHCRLHSLLSPELSSVLSFVLNESFFSMSVHTFLFVHLTKHMHETSTQRKNLSTTSKASISTTTPQKIQSIHSPTQPTHHATTKKNDPPHRPLNPPLPHPHLLQNPPTSRHPPPRPPRRRRRLPPRHHHTTPLAQKQL